MSRVSGVNLRNQRVRLEEESTMPQDLSAKQLRGLILLGFMAVLAIAGKLTWLDVPSAAERPAIGQQAERQTPVPAAAPTTTTVLPTPKPVPAGPALPGKVENRQAKIMCSAATLTWCRH